MLPMMEDGPPRQVLVAWKLWADAGADADTKAATLIADNVRRARTETWVPFAE